MIVTVILGVKVEANHLKDLQRLLDIETKEAKVEPKSLQQKYHRRIFEGIANQKSKDKMIGNTVPLDPNKYQRKRIESLLMCHKQIEHQVPLTQQAERIK